MPNANFKAVPFSPIATTLVLSQPAALHLHFATASAAIVRVKVFPEGDPSLVQTKNMETNGVTDSELFFGELPVGEPLVCTVYVDAEKGLGSVRVGIDWQ